MGIVKIKTDTPLTSGVIIDAAIKKIIKTSRQRNTQKRTLTIRNTVSTYIEIGSINKNPVINNVANVQLTNSSTGKKGLTDKSLLKENKAVNIVFTKKI